MVLDPLSALSIAGNIVQFIDFGSKLLNSSREIYHSAEGLSSNHQHLEQITQSLIDLNTKLSQNPATPTLTTHGQGLTKLAASCEKEGTRLLSAIARLKLEQTESKWRSFQQALKCVWKEHDLRELEKRLDGYRSELKIQLLKLLSDQQSDFLTVLRSLVDENRRMEIDRNQQVQTLVEKVDALGRSQVGTVRDVNFAELGAKLSELKTEASNLLTEQRILASLRFQQINIRHESIPEAHAKTFEWIFQESQDPESSEAQRPKTKFMEWLKQGGKHDGLYWIGGKAGSGKSTLMKFICDHPRTADGLKCWAGSNALVTANFFFWRSGTTLQKSQKGLLQTLLYEILRKCPRLISVSLQARWKQIEQGEWTRSELLKTFSMLRRDLKSSTRFCFFIDGLDEYPGDSRDLLRVLENLTAFENVKVCVSSRPWEIFKQAFDTNIDRRLYLQELTRQDIEIYVYQTFEEDPNFIQARNHDSKYNELVSEIVELAQGVFLWVFLVVRSLLRGLTSADTFKILQTRLRQLPTDLEDFFEHMLNSVDDVYQSQMARTFRVAQAAWAPLPLLLYSFVDDLEEDSDFALRLGVQTRSSQKATQSTKIKAGLKIKDREMTMEKRIDARSKGLLEISHQSTFSSQNKDLFLTKKVDFLHRTVSEFLIREDIQAKFALKTTSAFIPEVVICHSILAILKLLPLDIGEVENIHLVSRLVEDFLYYAYKVEVQTKSLVPGVVDDFGDALGLAFPSSLGKTKAKALNIKPTAHTAQKLNKLLFEQCNAQSFFEMCVQRGLRYYVAERIDQDPSLVLANWHRPLLSHALLPSKRLYREYPNPMNTVHLFFENGADPNAWDWAEFLGRYIREEFASSKATRRAGHGLPRSKMDQVLEMFLVKGANPNVSLAGSAVWGFFVIDLPELDLTPSERDERMSMIELFLKHGANPNGVYKNTTIWKRRLDCLYRRKDLTKFEHLYPRVLREVKTLLLAGGDPDIWIWKEGKRKRQVRTRLIDYPNDQSIDDAFEAIFYPDDKDALFKILRQKRAERGVISKVKTWIGPWR